MKICVLISCMYQHDWHIIQKSNIQTDVVVINQCNQNKIEQFTFQNARGKECQAKFIHTTERGLSKSRNMALRNATGDICLICDDDECLHDNYEQLILEGYQDCCDPDVLAFSLLRKNLRHKKIYPTIQKTLNFQQILRTSSLQISFKRTVIINNQITFDEKMGSGTGNGGGEEVKFLLDCRRKKLKLFYHPNCIATINPGESKWFNGYTNHFFENLGWSSRRIHGAFLSFIYCFYFVISHQTLYKKENSFYNALKYIYKGWFSKR